MNNEEDIAADTARELVAHTAELADVHLTEALTKALTEALKKVFVTSDTSKDPEEMKVLIRRIPILCTQIEAIHDNIKAIQDNVTWVSRLLIGGTISAILVILFKG